MQAILTRYLPPTNYQGARIVAQAHAGRRVYHRGELEREVLERQERAGSYHDEDIAILAATKFAAELGWLDGYHLESGTLPNGDDCHVRVKDATPDLTTELAEAREAIRHLHKCLMEHLSTQARDSGLSSLQGLCPCYDEATKIMETHGLEARSNGNA